MSNVAEDIINLFQWAEYEDKNFTILEALTDINNRYRLGIAKLRADLETAENTALRLAEKADAMRELLNEACASLDGSYNATDYPADGTSEQELTRDKIREFLSKP